MTEVTQENVALTDLLAEDLYVERSITDETAASIYLRMKETGVLGKLWYEEVPSLQAFINYCLSPENTVYVAYKRCPDLEPIGMGFLNRITPMGCGFKKAEIGFGFLPETLNGKVISVWEKIRAGRMILDGFFSTIAVDVVFGTTPEWNKEAIAYAERIGMDVSAKVGNFTTSDNGLVGVVISQMTKTAFYETMARRSNHVRTG